MPRPNATAGWIDGIAGGAEVARGASRIEFPEFCAGVPRMMAHPMAYLGSRLAPNRRGGGPGRRRKPARHPRVAIPTGPDLPGSSADTAEGGRAGRRVIDGR